MSTINNPIHLLKFDMISSSYENVFLCEFFWSVVCIFGLNGDLLICCKFLSNFNGNRVLQSMWRP